MSLHLVRHGHAGRRSAWTGEDELRPLSSRGRQQAEQIADLLAGAPIGRVASSPAVRCVETVTPLAARLGLEVRTDRRFAEGASVDDAAAWLLDHAEEHPVVCGHGDLIPVLLRRFRAQGMESDDGAVAHKGSLWTLEVDDGQVRQGTYHPPAR